MRESIARAFGALMAGISVVLPAAPSIAQQKPTLNIAESGGAFFNIIHYVAREKNFFQAQGAEPDIVVVQSGARQVAALMGGSVDVAPMGFQLIVQAVSKGGDLVAVATTYDIFPIAVTLSNDAIRKAGIVDAMSTDEKVKRLKGLKIAITSPGSGTDSMLRTLFVARGLVPDQEVSILPLGVPENMIAALQQQTVDGFLFSSPMPELAVSRGLGKIVIEPLNGDAPEVQGMPYVVLGTTRQALEKRRPQVMAAVRAYTQALRFTQEHPEEAREMTRRYFKEVDPAVFDAAFAKYLKGIPKGPVVTPEHLKKIVDWLNLTEKTPIDVRYEDAVYAGLANDAKRDLMPK